MHLKVPVRNASDNSHFAIPHTAAQPTENKAIRPPNDEARQRRPAVFLYGFNLVFNVYLCFVYRVYVVLSWLKCFFLFRKFELIENTEPFWREISPFLQPLSSGLERPRWWSLTRGRTKQYQHRLRERLEMIVPMDRRVLGVLRYFPENLFHAQREND